MRFVYSILVLLCTPLVLLYFALRGLRDKTYLQRWSERFGQPPAHLEPGGVLVHAASVGEVNACRALVLSLIKAYPDHAITVSTQTPTGSAQVRRELGDKVSTCYIPIDIPWAVKRFLQRLEPALIVIIETEIWPNLFRQAQRLDIPLVMANARLSEKSASHYRLASEFIARTLQKVRWIGAQSAADQRRLVECGSNPDAVRMTGNLKFDLEVDAGFHQQGLALREHWGQSRFVLVAGSTHEEDENVVLPAFVELLKTHSDALLILVPRHPERFVRAAQLARQAGLVTELYSQAEACSAQAQCFVIDTIGVLMRYYASGDIAFVGGSMGDVGGHNALEPAALGVPVLMGPNMDNAKEIAAQLVANGAALQVSGVRDLVSHSKQILADADLRVRMGQAGRALVKQNRGAVHITLEAIERHL